jgi:hypothetical protein
VNHIGRVDRRLRGLVRKLSSEMYGATRFRWELELIQDVLYFDP